MEQDTDQGEAVPSTLGDFFSQFVVDVSPVKSPVKSPLFTDDEEGNPSEQNNEKNSKRHRSSPKARSKSRKKQRKVKNSEEKQFLAGLMKNEELIWNKQHALHSNNNALLAAWKRVAKEMNYSVPECKSMWKSMRDALRYKRKYCVKGKSGDSGDEEHSEDASKDAEDVDITNMLSYLIPITEQFPRQTVTLGATDVDTSDTQEPKFDDSVYESTSSNYAYAVHKEKKDEVAESVQNISNAINQLVAVAASQQPPTVASDFKYNYIWKHVESLYGQLDETTINLLNQKIINMVYDEISKKSSNE